MNPAFAPLIGGVIGTLIYYRWRQFWPQFFDGLVRSLFGRPSRTPALAAQRWHELHQEDPAERRSRAVRDAYLRDEFGPEELDWRILLALKPPMPSEREWRRHERHYAAALADQWRTDAPGAVAGVPLVLTSSMTATAYAPETVTIPWAAAEHSPRLHRMMREGENCSFHELHSGSGYITTVCDCGHAANQHYNGGCNDCDAAFKRVERSLPVPESGGAAPAAARTRLDRNVEQGRDGLRSASPASWSHFTGVTMSDRIIVEKHWQ